jgi:hypothetical protein
MAKLQELQKRKRELQEENDIILTIGEEGKKGVKAAKEYFKDEEKKKEEQNSRHQEILKEKERSKFQYNIFLADILRDELSKLIWSKGYTYSVAPTEQGVVMEIEIPGPRYFRTAFKSTGDGVYDLNAVENFAYRAELTLEKHNGTIILP